MRERSTVSTFYPFNVADAHIAGGDRVTIALIIRDDQRAVMRHIRRYADDHALRRIDLNRLTHRTQASAPRVEQCGSGATP